MRRHKLALIFKIFFIISFSLLLYFFQLLKDTDYFSIKEVMTNAEKPLDFSELEGRNIFALNLKKITQQLSSAYPHYKKIRLIRVLPDKLYADFIRRHPLASLKLERYYCIDEDFVLFAGCAALDLPQICGLEKKLGGCRPGQRCNFLELAIAFNIIKEKELNPFLKDYKIRKIYLANAGNNTFFLESLQGNSRWIEVKIGREKFREKLGILSGILFELGKDLSRIKYIDLRFSEPVIKY